MRGWTRRWMMRPETTGMLSAEDENSTEAVLRQESVDVLGRLLRARGLMDEEAQAAFQAPRMADLHFPETLPGAEAAAVRLVEAVRGQRSIAIYGDYDVDGIMASSILYHVLALADPKNPPRIYVPHRIDEGYGLNIPALEKLASEGVEVLISVDCGVTAMEPARRAKELGIELIITDHHTAEVDDSGAVVLPDVSVLVHPSAGPEKAPFTQLCGGGVAFKVAWAFLERWFSSRPLPVEGKNLLVELLPFAALATIADVVSLHGENRILTAAGLRLIRSSKNPGLRALVQASGVLKDRDVPKASDVAFRLAPLLNAAGRLASADTAMHLMTRADDDEATQIVAELGRLNRQRQKMCREITEKASALVVEKGFNVLSRRAIVLADEDWNPGLVGICCSRLVEQFARPVILLQKVGDICRGSARSIRDYSIHDALKSCAQKLNADENVMTFGGHDAAAGLSIKADSFDEFVEHICDHAAENIEASELVVAVDVDDVVLLRELSLAVIEDIERLDPFGAGNPYPCFALSGLQVNQAIKMGKNGEHLRMNLSRDGVQVKAVWWRAPDVLDKLLAAQKSATLIDIVAEPEIDRWRAPQVQLKILDVGIDVVVKASNSESQLVAR
jgi:single-stranded-DNA-specific exonuclease